MLPRQLQPLAIASLFLLGLAAIGCSPGVQEDRSVHFSADGGTVAFQHGDEGVFVASADGQSLERIFVGVDGEEVLASSSPLWSPVDQRLIFTTVRPVADPNQPKSTAADTTVWATADWDSFPTGRPFYAGSMEYTCWLREAPTGNEQSQPPKPLFIARCNHSGYVAANLAVRWHPSGERILFVEQVDARQMGLFEFSLKSSNKRRLFEHAAESLVFTWSPQGSYLSASLYGTQAGKRDGLWLIADEQIAAPEHGWWHVPDSAPSSAGLLLDPLELLRRSQPVWNAQDDKLAYLHVDIPSSNKRAEYSLNIVEPSTREVQRLFTSSEWLRDLRWHPSGKRLGFAELNAAVKGDDGVAEGGQQPLPRSTLNVFDLQGVVSQPLAGDDREEAEASLTKENVQQFVGWNAQGNQFAFVSPLELNSYRRKWCLLFPAVAAARDRVWIVEDAQLDGPPGTKPIGQPAIPRELHSGMRITYPQWSPTENRLSLWGTFTPTHRSWLSLAIPWALRPGDPAAVLDVESGELSWLVVNKHEKAQIGHYYLLKRDYQRAWEWYAQAGEGREPPQAQPLNHLWSSQRLNALRQEPWFFEYYCLLKLNRQAEAQERLAAFRESLTFRLPSADDPAEARGSWFGLDLNDPSTQGKVQALIDRWTPLVRASYAAEIFLSLDASADGVRYFREWYSQASSESETFAAAIGLTQMLLADTQHEQYASFVSQSLIPLVEQLAAVMTLPPSVLGSRTQADDDLAWLKQAEELGVLWISGMSVLPLASTEFLQTLPEASVRELLPVWQAFADRTSLPVDLVVVAALERLGKNSSQAAANVADIDAWLPQGDGFELQTPQQADALIESMSQAFEATSM